MSGKKIIAALMVMTLAVGSGSTGIAGVQAYAEEPEAAEESILPGQQDTDLVQSEVPGEQQDISDGETVEEQNEWSDNETMQTEEEAAAPEASHWEAEYSAPIVAPEERVAVGGTVQIDISEYNDWYGTDYTLRFDQDLAEIVSAAEKEYVTIRGLQEGSTVLHVIYQQDVQDPGYEETEPAEPELIDVQIPVKVTNINIRKQTYTVYTSGSTGAWGNYASVDVHVDGLDAGSKVSSEDADGAWVNDYYKSEGYIRIDTGKNVSVTITIDGKPFVITIQFVKAELGASNTISKYLGSLVTYSGKKDTLVLKLDEVKATPKSWKSLDTSVATVSKSGQVTGKGLGRTYIRAYLDDESYMDYLVECTYKGAYQAVSNGFHDYESGDGKGYKIIRYSQPKRMNKGFRDCSSFVYRCYYDRTLGRKIFDIGATGGSWAANASAQASWLKSQGKTVANKLVSVDKLLPGDTMYTRGPEKNGEWRDIYHAFLYVGNGCVITTYTSDGKGKTLALKPYNYDGYNVVYIGRPLASNRKTKSISLSKKSVSLGVKEKYTLKASKKPVDSAQAVKWSSSKTSVAAVSSKGVVTAKKKGTAYITVRSGSYSARCKVVVKSAPKKIKLNKKRKTLPVKKSFQMKCTLSKGSASGKIKYSSSDPKVASVSSSGKITAKKKGNAVITAVTYNGKRAAIKVKVK